MARRVSGSGLAPRCAGSRRQPSRSQHGRCRSVSSSTGLLASRGYIARQAPSGARVILKLRADSKPGPERARAEALHACAPCDVRGRGSASSSGDARPGDADSARRRAHTRRSYASVTLPVERTGRGRCRTRPRPRASLCGPPARSRCYAARASRLLHARLAACARRRFRAFGRGGAVVVSALPTTTSPFRGSPFTMSHELIERAQRVQ